VAAARIAGALRRTRGEGHARGSGRIFASRPLVSQLGAWASDQSKPLASREELEERFAALEKKYQGKPVPRPPHWGGFRVAPLAVEFWWNRPAACTSASSTRARRRTLPGR